METLELGYGESSVRIEPREFEIVGSDKDLAALSDQELGERLENPVGGAQIEDIVREGGTVLLVVPDATRSSAAGQVVNLLIRRLIAAGILPHEINAIFATGIHRPVTEAEKELILTPFVAQRTPVLEHRPRDLMGLVALGETSGGIRVELNRAVVNYDHVITVGAVGYHYFAGFTGGRKLICPGLASTRTISKTHELAFDRERLERAEGVGPGKLEGNPVHEAFVEAVSFAPPAFSVNTIVDRQGAAADLVCGDWRKSHEAACERFSEAHTVVLKGKKDLVIVSCGGAPHDINLIQAHKALEAASNACIEGGTIVLVAKCADGTGRADFLDWFEAGSSRALAERLAENYKVNGQTAWSLLSKTERFNVQIVTELPEETISKTGMRKIDPQEVGRIASTKGGYLMPFGARYLPVIKE
ncbi:MAG: nickel-dependent lactate racemase [Acidobacteria bacterium]|nr:MAG: nickel-dependent lactate racemase [Acidobacteriota bacterium]REJ99037.1 MAG: nickel-dependent lactate racemase [Acidobacteriota bacterium]REK16242.1 MAG: nickel-dependent lactate racemase [Acidobacteriota bacterium]REK43923.1 MAG: nickel-dependent lactate racemase [Acidobacteriota bacterium]